MPADKLTATFAALADPTRRAILGRLAKGQSSVTELASPFKMTMPAISKHLKVLEKAGLIERGRDAQWRPCRLKAKPLEEVPETKDDDEAADDDADDNHGTAVMGTIVADQA